MDKKQWRIAAAVSFAASLVLNGLAGATTLLNGWNTADVSAAYPTLFTPAGFTFAIWGVIYLLLTGFTFYQLGVFGKTSKETNKTLDAVAPRFALLSLVNATWIIVWQYNVIWLSVLLIITMLVMLVQINAIIAKQKTTTSRDYWLLRAPFSVYFGWITVATVANISVWLVSIHWNGFGWDPNMWLGIILWVAAAVGIAGTLRNRDWLYGTVFVWAYFGILLAQPRPASVVGNLALLLALLAGASGYVLSRMREK